MERSFLQITWSLSHLWKLSHHKSYESPKFDVMPFPDWLLGFRMLVIRNYLQMQHSGLIGLSQSHSGATHSSNLLRILSQLMIIHRSNSLATCFKIWWVSCVLCKFCGISNLMRVIIHVKLCGYFIYTFSFEVLGYEHPHIMPTVKMLLGCLRTQKAKWVADQSTFMMTSSCF